MALEWCSVKYFGVNNVVCAYGIIVKLPQYSFVRGSVTKCLVWLTPGLAGLCLKSTGCESVEPQFTLSSLWGFNVKRWAGGLLTLKLTLELRACSLKEE